jgi:hypothetical protein
MSELWINLKRTFDRKLPEFRLGLALALACSFLAATAAGAATVTASLDRDTISLGETATVGLTYSGGGPSVEPAFPAIPNLQITSTGRSSQFTFSGGQANSTETYNFTIVPQQPGDFIIPAITTEVNGARLTTQPLRLRVLKPSAPPPAAVNSGSQMSFIKLLLPKKEIYLGETIIGELQLYVRDGVQNISQLQVPSFPADGFTVGKLTQQNRRRAQFNGVGYTVLPFAFTLRPIKTGSFEAGPVTMSAVLDLPSRDGRRDFPFGGIFGSTDQKQVSMTSEGEKVQALPLPSLNVPPGFNGAVGNYTMTATAGPTQIAVGDPITVRVQIAGRGAFDALTLPDQSAWRDFKSYPPTSKVETTDPFGLQGTKTFEQVIVPQNSEIKELPPVSFSFFDPDQKVYRTLTQPAVRLVVRPGGAAVAPSVVAGPVRPGQETPPPAQDIVHIKPRVGMVGQIAPPLLQQPWFLALQGIPILAWLSALVWRRRTEHLAHNPRLRRQRQVAQRIREGLLQLRRLAKENKSEEFFATLVHLLQEQLGERLDLPASAITEAVIDERLRPLGVPATTLTALQELFQTCNLVRYAPIKSSQELEAMVPKFEALLGQLKGIKA